MVEYNRYMQYCFNNYYTNHNEIIRIINLQIKNVPFMSLLIKSLYEIIILTLL